MAQTSRPSKSEIFRPVTAVASTAQGKNCAANHADFRRICPNCGAELWDKECKSRCPRCHFFTDCSDPW